MPSTGPIVGFLQIAHAYGLKPMPTRRATTPQTQPAPAGGAAAPKPGAKLIASTVPGRVNFSGESPAHDRSALAMYAHPADKNAAATAVSAGRMLDVTA